jgi:hypothetical protein
MTSSPLGYNDKNITGNDGWLNHSVASPQLPYHADSTMQQSHASTQHAQTIRNYTSLQDIAMNDDESDEEDRF